MAGLVGRYQPIATLGHGGMADVYLAVSRGPEGFNKLCVIKRLRPNLADEPEFLKLLLDEARLAARLNHPNVVQTYEFGEANGRYYIVMEYLEGQPLNRVLQRAGTQGRIPLVSYLGVMSQVLRGLHYAHELADFDGTPLEVVHRDVSPHNIFVTYQGVAKLVDFGIARASTSSGETRAGQLKGKVAFMAPEQSRSPNVDRRADLFSVGVVLAQILAGKKLWADLTDEEIVERLGAGKIPKLGEVAPDAPAELLAICDRALAFAPVDRFQTADELRKALDLCLDRSKEREASSDLGDVVAELFSEERAEIRNAVERRMKGLPDDFEDAPSLGALDDDGATASIPHLATGSGNRHLTPSFEKPTSQTTTGVKPRFSLLGIGLLGALAIGRAGLIWMKSAKHSASAASSPVSAHPSMEASPEAAPVATSVRVRISVTPSEAKVFLDGAPLPSNPYSAEFHRDGTTHTVRAESEGYKTRSEVTVFDKETSLDLELEKQVVEVAKPIAKPGAGIRPAKPVPSEGAKHEPSLDTDPWAK